MDLLSRFSTHLQDVLARAIHLATELGNPEVEPIHLFYALTTQKGAVALDIISRLKINQKILEDIIAGLPTTSTQPKQNLKQSVIVEKVITPLSANSKTVLEKALFTAQEYGHNYVGTEHLLFALIGLSDENIKQLLTSSHVKIVDLNKQIDVVLNNVSQFPKMAEVADIASRIVENMDGASTTAIPKSSNTNSKQRKKESALDFFAVNLTDRNVQKEIDPVIGREAEIERMIQIICRRTKNNPILLGDPGVGKTAIVEGLAKRIVNGDVPDLLLNKKIYSLDMGLLIAGTIYRGEFEMRLRQVIDEVASDPNIIIFIDEIHNIVGAGSNQGAMDAANILKPALARGFLRCIGSTTPAELKKHIESDSALERRFQPIMVKEPSLDEAVQILAGIKKNYELYHNIEITDEAVSAAVNLSARHITGKFLPDKAIDLLDETASAARLKAKIPASANRRLRLEKRLEKTILAKENAAANDKFADAVKYKKEETAVRSEIKKLIEEAKNKTPKKYGTITARDVAIQVAKITGASPTELLLDNKQRFIDLEKQIKNQITGQNESIQLISQIIRQAQLGLSSTDRPFASFLFAGNSGVGKTELAKVIANLLYPGQDALIKLDMSEFSEAHSTSKILGSPAGYVGHKDINQFTDRVKLNPFSVILFDEIDKAHRDVTKLLLQILENGEITDATGKKISLKHAIIVLTTTLGAGDAKKGGFGFGSLADSQSEIKNKLMEKMKDHFSPELINRIDAICLFNDLSPIDLTKIAQWEIDRLNERLAQYHTGIKTSSEVLIQLTNLPDKAGGARDLRRQIRQQVESLMAEIILGEKIKKSYELISTNNKFLLKK